MKTLKLCALFSITLLITPLSMAKGSSIEKLVPAFEKKIAQTMKANSLPGVAVAIVTRDKVVYLKTFGVKQFGKKDKISSKTLFQLCSLSKPISATALAILQEKKALSFDDPVSRFLPNFQLKDSQGPLKISHVLSHTTGVPKEGFNPMIESFVPRDEIFNRAQQTPVAADPGESFAYHNVMFGLTEDIISRASGKSFERTLNDRIFIPLGMKNACVGFDALMKSKDRVYPHVKNKKGRVVPVKGYSKGYYAFSASAGINASLQDLVPFLKLYLGAFPHVLSPKSIETLTAPRIEDPVLRQQFKEGDGSKTDPAYGLGWRLMKYKGEDVTFHPGWLKGFSNILAYLPDYGVGIIVLVNSEGRESSKIAFAFFDAYIREFAKMKAA